MVLSLDIYINTGVEPILKGLHCSLASKDSSSFPVVPLKSVPRAEAVQSVRMFWGWQYRNEYAKGCLLPWVQSTRTCCPGGRHTPETGGKVCSFPDRLEPSLASEFPPCPPPPRPTEYLDRTLFWMGLQRPFKAVGFFLCSCNLLVKLA